MADDFQVRTSPMTDRSRALGRDLDEASSTDRQRVLVVEDEPVRPLALHHVIEPLLQLADSQDVGAMVQLSVLAHALGEAAPPFDFIQVESGHVGRQPGVVVKCPPGLP